MRKGFSILLTLFLCLSWISAVGEVKAHSTSSKGSLVIVGGSLGSSNNEVYQAFIERAGGNKKAKIGIIPVASSSLNSSYDFKGKMVELGIEEKSVEILQISNHDFKGTDEDEAKWKNNVNKKEIVKKIEGLTGIWFVGGDQIKITSTLLKKNGKKTKALEAIWKIYQNGAVIGGTSAGAAIMSDVMISGGDSIGGFKNEFVNEDIYYPDKEYNPVFISKGLGFFQHGIVDQHFDERARLGRLISTAVDFEANKEKYYSYGIDEDTALVVDNKDQKASIVGRGGVAVIDTNSAKKDENKGTIQNVKFSYLSSGDMIHLDTKEIKMKEGKYQTKGEEYYDFQPLPATGILSSYGRLKEYLAYALVDNASADSVQSFLYESSGEGFKLSFKEAEDTNGYWGYNDGQKDDYSIVNVVLDIEPASVTFKEEEHIFENYREPVFRPSSSTVESSKIKGNLVIAGGALGSSNSAVYNKFIELARVKGDTRIGIIPAASSSLKSSELFKKDLIQYGVENEAIEILPLSNHDFKGTVENESSWLDNRNNEELAKKMKDFTAIWFVGGDQTNITASLLNDDMTHSKVLNAIWDIYKNGAVLGGTSAGAAIMSDVMIAGGGSYDTLSKGFTETYDGMTQQEGGPGYLEQGLGFFQEGIIDQHFDKKARLGRLIAVTDELGEQNELSYGIDEDTAMVVNNNQNTIEVIGRGGVSLLDLSSMKKAGRKMENIELSWLTEGDQFSLDTHQLKIKESKVETKGYEYYNSPVAPHSGVLTPHGSLGHFLSYQLVDNEAVQEVKSYSFHEGKGFELTFKKGKETNGYWGYKDGGKDHYSYEKVIVDVVPGSFLIKD